MFKKILSVILGLTLLISPLCLPESKAYASEASGKKSTVEERISKLSNEEALELLKQGSYGFFKFMGSDNSAAALKNAPLARYTSIGSCYDATNLKNMKKSLGYLKTFNEIRKKEGLSPLKITDYAMAVGQSNANASAATVSHTHQFNYGENLAWGMPHPFNRWYTKEKQWYYNGNAGAATHFRNIRRPWATTGFGVNQKGPYDLTTSQVFSYRSNYTYTLDEYTERFNEYFSAISAKVTVKTSIRNIEALNDGFKVTWDEKSSGTSGYEIRYSTWEAMKDPVKVKVSGKEHSVKTVSGLKSDKAYFVQVRTYRIVNGRAYYSNWSEKVKVKTK